MTIERLKRLVHTNYSSYKSNLNSVKIKLIKIKTKLIHSFVLPCLILLMMAAESMMSKRQF